MGLRTKKLKEVGNPRPVAILKKRLGFKKGGVGISQKKKEKNIFLNKGLKNREEDATGPVVNIRVWEQG